MAAQLRSLPPLHEARVIRSPGMEPPFAAPPFSIESRPRAGLASQVLAVDQLGDTSLSRPVRGRADGPWSRSNRLCALRRDQSAVVVAHGRAHLRGGDVLRWGVVASTCTTAQALLRPRQHQITDISPPRAASIPLSYIAAMQIFPRKRQRCAVLPLGDHDGASPPPGSCGRVASSATGRER